MWDHKGDIVNAAKTIAPLVGLGEHEKKARKPRKLKYTGHGFAQVDDDDDDSNEYYGQNVIPKKAMLKYI